MIDRSKLGNKYINIPLILATTIGLTIGGIEIKDNNVDHLNEYCPLNNLFGVEHQIDKINHDYRSLGIRAYYVEGDKTDIYYNYVDKIDKTDDALNYNSVVEIPGVVKSVYFENNDPKILITKGEIMINKEGQQIGICEADKYKIIKVPKKNK